VENIGIGAKAITAKPSAVDRAVLKRAMPVLRAVANKAALLSRLLLNS
jgi:hypothetical protein